VATLLRMALTPFIGGSAVPFITYFPTVLFVAWFGGFRPAALSILLSAFAADYYFVSPRAVPDPSDRIMLLVFVLVGFGIAWLSHSQRRAVERADRELELRKEAESAEREQRIRLGTTLASIGDAVIATDAGGRIVFVNPVAQSLARWPEAEMLGKPIDEVFRIVNEDSREKVESPIAKVLREGNIVGLANHTVLIARDGTEIPIDDSGAPIRGESGAIEGTVLVFRDITERRQAENALRESEQRFRTLADSAPVLIWVSGLDKKCTWFNRPWLEFTGRTMEQALRAGWADGVHPEDRQRCLSIYEGSFDRREPFRMDYRLRRHDGEWRWVLDHGIPLQQADGTFVGYIGSCVDITERRQAEDERGSLLAREQAARAEAEHANRLKDEFLSIVSHELRTPLAAVLGWAQLLQGDSLDASTRQRALTVIERSAKAQAKLLEDILDVSRVVSGKLRLDFSPVQLPEIIEAALESIRPAAASKGIQLESAIDPEASAVRGDAERLEQVVWNLLSNAVKFTPEGGRVAIRLQRVDSQLEITVSDTGEGMPADFLPYAFEAFRQADASPSRRHGGLGLGLAIVRHVIELHGGTVHAHSDGPGRGAVFTIRLPHAAGEDGRGHEAAASEETVAGLQGLRILIAEDDPDTRHLLTVLLETRGAQVSGAASAAEALDVFRLHRPDVVLCDIGLPGQDGYALIRQIRALEAEQGGAVPAVALSAYARSEDREQALAAGFQMHLSKPVNPRLVTRAIKTAAGQQQALARGAAARADGSQMDQAALKVVVIDDAKDLVDMFAVVLREMGHQVDVFYDGPSALRQIAAIQPHVIFSDISMRQMNGYELAKRLREMPELRHTALVAMTGFGQDEDGGHTLRAGFDYHLVKPVLGAQLRDVFRRLAAARPGEADAPAPRSTRDQL
jgi:PAS domain S-box-containing protein